MSESEKVNSIASHMRNLAGAYPSYMTGINSAIAGGNMQEILKNSIAGNIFMDNSVRYYQEEIKRHAEMMKSVAGSIPISAVQQIGANLSSLIVTGGNIGASAKMMQEEVKRQREMMGSICTINPMIYSTFANPTVVRQSDEEISIKKSQWNDLQEELASKEQRISHLEKRVSELEKTTIPELDRKVDDAMGEFHTDMEKNMPDVHHVAKYLRGMEYNNLGDPVDDLE